MGAGVAGFVFVVVGRGDDYLSFMYYHHDSSTSSTSTLRTPNLFKDAAYYYYAPLVDSMLVVVLELPLLTSADQHMYRHVMGILAMPGLCTPHETLDHLFHCTNLRLVWAQTMVLKEAKWRHSIIA